MNTSEKDIPISVAVLCLIVVAGGWMYVSHLHSNPRLLQNISQLVETHMWVWTSGVIVLAANLGLIGSFFKRTIGLQKQGSRLKKLEGKKAARLRTTIPVFSFILSVKVLVLSGFLIKPALEPLTDLLGASVYRWLLVGMSLNYALCAGFIAMGLLSWLSRQKFLLSRKKKLDEPLLQPNALTLGTTPISEEDGTESEEWVSIPARGLNAGILVTGSVGSGKSQGTILRYLHGLISSGRSIPAMLLIDPKGTFLRQAEEMLRSSGLGERIVKISLSNAVTFNPVYCDQPLKKARFVGLAEMARAASSNFLGRSSDSQIWDANGSYLVRNAIVYCAACYGYFTLLDLYKTIIRASNEDLAADLKECLKAERFDAEEKFNIERAIDYFENDYGQLADRTRSSVTFTATSFINQFHEYSASRVFCPTQEELVIASMDEAITAGKIILFDIQQPGLARSMGTFIKLHFQQAVLNLLEKRQSGSKAHSVVLLIDEYQDVVTCGGGGTLGDESFMAKAREAQPTVIVATQSLSSLMNAIGNQKATQELVQNFRTRIACHSSDLETINVFRELAGQEERSKETRSLSEFAQKSERNLLLGGFDSQTANLSESVSHATRPEYIWTGKEFSRLKTFEALAQVFDGIETRYLKLYLKPHFLKAINTPHQDVLEMLRDNQGATPKGFFSRLWKSVASALVLLGVVAPLRASVPNACTVARGAEFQSCLDLKVTACVCGYPPRPCAQVSYYVPQTFIEVWPESGQSYFGALPGTRLQLSAIPKTPFGAEGDEDTQSYHAHTIAVPLTSLLFSTLPAGGTRTEKMCFDGMSEHLNSHWATGKGDLTQPLFLAWSAAPKACLLKGAAMSVTGEVALAPKPGGLMCSVPLPKLEWLPPSSHPACTGWGVFYPRYGTYSGPASLTGALMIGARMKSLSVEVFQSMPQGLDEKWQMTYPQTSSCFREGQNLGLLETVKNARENERLLNGKMKGYLFVIWQKTSRCVDLAQGIQAQVAARAIPALCQGLQ